MIDQSQYGIVSSNAETCFDQQRFSRRGVVDFTIWLGKPSRIWAILSTQQSWPQMLGSILTGRGGTSDGWIGRGDSKYTYYLTYNVSYTLESLEQVITCFSCKWPTSPTQEVSQSRANIAPFQNQLLWAVHGIDGHGQVSRCSREIQELNLRLTVRCPASFMVDHPSKIPCVSPMFIYVPLIRWLLLGYPWVSREKYAPFLGPNLGGFQLRFHHELSVPHCDDGAATNGTDRSAYVVVLDRLDHLRRLNPNWDLF